MNLVSNTQKINFNTYKKISCQNEYCSHLILKCPWDKIKIILHYFVKKIIHKSNNEHHTSFKQKDSKCFKWEKKERNTTRSKTHRNQHICHNRMLICNFFFLLQCGEQKKAELLKTWWNQDLGDLSVHLTNKCLCRQKIVEPEFSRLGGFLVTTADTSTFKGTILLFSQNTPQTFPSLSCDIDVYLLKRVTAKTDMWPGYY